MTTNQKEILINRILSGYIRIDDLKVHYPTSEQLYEASELYEDVFEKAIEAGSYTEDQLLGFMVENGLWDVAKEEELKVAEDNIEKIKLKMFEMVFRTNDRIEAKKVLRKTEGRISELRKIKHAHDFLLADYVATVAKTRLLVGLNIEYPDGARHWSSSRSYYESDDTVDTIMGKFFEKSIGEAKYREIARTDPWRLQWNGMKIVPTTTTSLASQEFKLLLFWSKIYDNIHESPDCPPDEIINDDDMLDGWMIAQKNKRDAELTQMRLEKGISSSDKIRNAQEVYIVAQTNDDATKIHNMNDAYGKHMKAKRWEALKRAGGKINEIDMPDTKERLITAVNQKFRDGVMGK